MGFAVYYSSLYLRCTLGIFFKRIILAIFPIYCFHFLVVHTVYAKMSLYIKIYLRILHLEDFESTLRAKGEFT